MTTAAQEIALMKKDISILSKEVKSLCVKMDILTKQLLNPDDGFVVRVNKNTAAREERESSMPMYNKIIGEFHDLKRWKGSVSKALWGLYAAVVGYVIKLIFW
jgi:hypothetical protein